MHSILLTGTNKGIGLELVKQILCHSTIKPEILIATARNTSKAKELQDLAKKDKRLHILELDITKFDTYKAFIEKVAKIVGEKGLTILFHNAGILLQTRLPTLDAEALTNQFVCNTLAPILLTKVLLPLVKKAAATAGKEGISVNRAALLFMSSISGSVKGNEGEYAGILWGYRESKAALNQAARSFCKEVHSDGIGVLILHPGWVKTELGGPHAMITPTESVQGLLKVIISLDDKNNGTFFQYDGSVLPW